MKNLLMKQLVLRTAISLPFAFVVSIPLVFAEEWEDSADSGFEQSSIITETYDGEAYPGEEDQRDILIDEQYAEESLDKDTDNNLDDNPESELYDNSESELYDNPESELYDNPESDSYEENEEELVTDEDEAIDEDEDEGGDEVDDGESEEHDGEYDDLY